MSNANTPRFNVSFQYRLRFFHKCRSPGGCDPGQIDRFQIQGSALESTCGAPIIVVLVRYRHDPESGLSRECQRAQFVPGAAFFAVKAIVVPADQVLSYMDQPLLQQPRLVDLQGRPLLGGPDVSADGCIYVTPLEKNGIAHLNNFCLVQPYTGLQQDEAAAVSGSGMGLGPSLGPPQHRQHSGSCGGGTSRGPEATRRMRAMLNSDGGAPGCVGLSGSLGGGPGLGLGSGLGSALSGCAEVIQDSADVLAASPELCLLVQLLRRDAQRPGRWFAYDMPHLISRPFQVIPRSALLAMQQPPPELVGSPRQHVAQQEQLMAAVAQGRDFTAPRRSTGRSLVGGPAPSGRDVNMPVLPQTQPQPFMSPQYKRHHSAGGFGPVPSAGLASYCSGPGLPSRMGVMGAPMQQQSQDCGAVTGFIFGGAGGGGEAIGGARRRSCLSKDSSHDDSSVGAPMAASGATTIGSLRTPSITSGAATDSAAAVAAVNALPAAAAAGALAAMAPGPAPSPPFSPMSRQVHAVAPGLAAAAQPALAVAALDAGAAAAASLRGSEEGRSLPLALRQAPSATLLDLNISDLLNDIQPQPLLGEDMMELEQTGAPKRVRSNTTAASDVAAFVMSDNNSSSHHLMVAASSPRCAVSPQKQHHQQQQYQHHHHQQQLEGYLASRSGGGVVGGAIVGGYATVTTARSGGGCAGRGGDGGGGGGYGQLGDGFVSRTDSWSAEIAPEQLLMLSKQSTGLSGSHAASSFAIGNGSTSLACSGAAPSMGAAPAAPAPAAFGGGEAIGNGDVGCGGGGDRSGGSSASQLDLLMQLLGQPGAMQDALDRMEQEQEEQQQRQAHQQHQRGFEGVAQPACSGGEDMQV